MIIRRMEEQSTSRLYNPWFITGTVIGLNILAQSLPYSCTQLRQPVFIAALLVPAITMTCGKWKKHQQVRTCGSLLIVLILVNIANLLLNSKGYNTLEITALYEKNVPWVLSMSNLIVQGIIVYLTNKLLITCRQNKGEPAFQDFAPLVIPQWLILTLIGIVAAESGILSLAFFTTIIPFQSVFDKFAFLTAVNWDGFLQLLFFISLSFTLFIRLKLSDGTGFFPKLSPTACFVALLATYALTTSFPFVPGMLSQSLWTPNYYIINILSFLIFFLLSLVIILAYSTGKWATIPMIRNTRNFFMIYVIIQLFNNCSQEMMMPVYLKFIALIIPVICNILVLFSNNKAIQEFRAKYHTRHS